MTLSPLRVDISSRDPYELDRLADELASRELLTGHTKHHDLVNVPELQEPLPLSHNNPRLTAEVFDVEEFLLERRQIPLPDLRAELRQYLAELKEELVKLINDDYEAFISLSTDLRDEGARLERLKYPLATLKADVNVCHLLSTQHNPKCLLSTFRSPRKSWRRFKKRFTEN